MREQLEPIWSAVREELRRQTPDLKFHLWLEPLELAGVDGRTLYVRAPEHVRTVVSERYLPLLRQAAASRFDARAVVRVVSGDWQRPEGADREGANRSLRPPLNPRYTFEQFVIGDANRLAHAAALAVAELPAQAYNPLFLHGAPGLGKTHLLHAIGDYVARYGSGLHVRYATVEEFTTEFVEALRARRATAFRESFRRADVVLIDDVQFFARKERTREEFFHTFNALVGSGRQLVLTSDRAPDELPDLERRLAERFVSGLVVELTPPEQPVRRAILAKRARIDGIDVPAAVLDEIATTVTQSVRALEGALIRVVAYASLRQLPLTPELVRQLLCRVGGLERRTACDLPAIVSAAADEFGVPREELLARGRTATTARARQVAMFLARELTAQSLPVIGREIGGRNHATVLHAVRKIEDELRRDTALRSAVDNVRRRIAQAT